MYLVHIFAVSGLRNNQAIKVVGLKRHDETETRDSATTTRLLIVCCCCGGMVN